MNTPDDDHDDSAEEGPRKGFDAARIDPEAIEHLTAPLAAAGAAWSKQLGAQFGDLPNPGAQFAGSLKKVGLPSLVPAGAATEGPWAGVLGDARRLSDAIEKSPQMQALREAGRHIVPPEPVGPADPAAGLKALAASPPTIVSPQVGLLKQLIELTERVIEVAAESSTREEDRLKAIEAQLAEDGRRAKVTLRLGIAVLATSVVGVAVSVVAMVLH